MTDNTSKLGFTNARLLAVQTLYAHIMTDEAWDKLMSRALLGELGGQALAEENKKEDYIALPAADSGLFTRIVQAYRDNAEAIDTAIKSSLSENIAFDKLETTFLCILRAGLAEFYANPETDAPIIINEYVDITRSFYDGTEVKIANGLLHAFSQVLRS